MTSVESRFSRFSLVGLIGALLQLLLISLLKKCFRIGSVAATLIAVEITILHNFIWHQRFTWRDRDPNNSWQIARLWRFHAGNGLISLGGNTILMYCLAERLTAPIVPTAIGAIVLCSLANFLVADRWVYTSISAYNASKRRTRDIEATASLNVDGLRTHVESLDSAVWRDPPPRDRYR